jgi:hypothetical protein
MSQHDLILDNAAGASIRADLNTALQALGSWFCGASAPATTYAGLRWLDTTANCVKVRNQANSAWITLPLDPVNAISLLADTRIRGSFYADADAMLGLQTNGFIAHTRSADSGDYLHLAPWTLAAGGDWTKGIVLKRSNGYVGIATAAPAAMLDVNGALRFRSGVLTFPDASTAETAGTVAAISSQADTTPFTTTSGSFVNYPNVEATVMVNNTTGNEFLIIANIQAAVTAGGPPGFIKLYANGSDQRIGAAAGSRTRVSAIIPAFPSGTYADRMGVNITLVGKLAGATTGTTFYAGVQVQAPSGGAVYINRAESDSDAATRWRAASSVDVIALRPGAMP